MNQCDEIENEGKVKRVTAVVLNWNGTSDTLNCLASLLRVERNDLILKIIAVDNGSDVDSTLEIKAAFPETHTIRLSRNIGFAAGCNVGAKQALVAGADYILFLNNDTEVEPDFLRPLIAAVQKNARIGLACSLIKTMDGAIEFAGATINFAAGSFKSLRHLRSDSSVVPTDYVSGCSMLVPVRTLEVIGTFDEGLFSYFEDTDLSLRAQRAGLDTVLVPESVVRHKGAASTRRDLAEGTTSPLKHYLVARNRIMIIRRHAPIFSRVFFMVLIQPVVGAFYIIGFAVRGRWKKARCFLYGLRDGLINRKSAPQFDKFY